MRLVDFYNVNQANGYGDYGLTYAGGNLRQLGTENLTTHIESKRFTTADGTPIVYAGYTENSMNLLLECDTRTTTSRIRALAASGVFVVNGILTADDYSSFGRLCYTTGDITATCVSQHDGIYQLSIPVLFSQNGLRVPEVQLIAPSGISFSADFSFEIGGSWVDTTNCRVLSDGSRQLKESVYIAPGTSLINLCIAATAYGSLTNGIVITFCRKNGSSWFKQGVDANAAASAPGVYLNIPDDAMIDCYLDITAADAKPLRIYFTLRRYYA